jgi:hypothetical protein
MVMVPAAEGQQLPRQAGRPLAGLVDQFEVGLDPAAVVDRQQQPFTVAVDDRQQVVEVVRDTAGQLAHGLELL